MFILIRNVVDRKFFILVFFNTFMPQDYNSYNQTRKFIEGKKKIKCDICGYYPDLYYTCSNCGRTMGSDCTGWQGVSMCKFDTICRICWMRKNRNWKKEKWDYLYQYWQQEIKDRKKYPKLYRGKPWNF